MSWSLTVDARTVRLDKQMAEIVSHRLSFLNARVDARSRSLALLSSLFAFAPVRPLPPPTHSVHFEDLAS
jgi:hypothetical protein